MEIWIKRGGIMYKVLFSATLALFLFPSLLLAGSIVGSKHDLSVTNYYGATAGASQEVCVFCHTPHGANETEISGGPIWNRKITDMNAFEMYGGVGSPNYLSLVCLSCHDGVSSQGAISAVSAYDGHNILNPPNGDPGSPSCVACHSGGGAMPDTIWQIGPILTDDHPISIDYFASVAAAPAGDFKATPDPEIKLFGNKVECASCHDVHNPDFGFFLRKANDQSQLCQSCHAK